MSDYTADDFEKWQAKQEKKKKRRKRRLIILAVVAVIIIGFIALGSSGSDSDGSSVAPASNASTETTQPINKDDFIASCKEIKYKDIARNPNNYVGTNVKFTGLITQVMDETTLLGDYEYTMMLVDTGDDGDGYYFDDTVYVTYVKSENESKYLEDDIITFYGVCQGEKSYTSIMNEQITIPLVDVKFIDLIDEG